MLFENKGVIRLPKPDQRDQWSRLDTCLASPRHQAMVETGRYRDYTDILFRLENLKITGKKIPNCISVLGFHPVLSGE